MSIPKSLRNLSIRAHFASLSGNFLRIERDYLMAMGKVIGLVAKCENENSQDFGTVIPAIDERKKSLLTDSSVTISMMRTLFLRINYGSLSYTA